MISSQTKVTGLFGHPVTHSKSPQMHNRAFQHLGLDTVYVAFDVEPDAIGAAVQSLRALGVSGVNVTIPHKVSVIPFLDELSSEAKVIGAVNTIVNRGGRLIGYNTDGIGYLSALQEETGFDAAGRRVLLLGAGGAARAVAAQIALSGAAQVTVAARALDKAEALAGHLAAHAQTSGITMEQAAKCAHEYDLVVNTTPLGMHPNVDAVPLDTACLREGQLVSDLIYNPRLTRFLREAQERGCAISGGLGMFIHQGAHSFRLWTGQDAPVDVMRETVESYL